MKIFGVVASLFLSLNVIGQKSYYFSEPVSSVNTVSAIDSKYFGTYTSSSGRTYEINEEGIFIISTSISSMDRESIRESAKYDVRNGFIHGVLKNDSIPCVLDGERYYFGVRNKDLLIGATSENVLTQSSSNKSMYFVNLKEDNVYVPMQLIFSKKNMHVAYFDYDFETKSFDHIANQKTIANGFNDLVILSPDEDEFGQISFDEIFPEGIDLKKSK